MSVITAIEQQKKRDNRRSVFVDGEFVAGVHEDIVLALGLSVGQSFDRDRLVELIQAETKRKAFDSALHLLSYRDRSISEVRRRLIRHEYPEEIVEEVLEQLSRLGYLDDEQFSRKWVNARTSSSKPMGKTRLAWELRAKGVDAPLVEEALETIDEDQEYAMAYSLAEKKLEKADRSDPALKNRIVSVLRRRGFNWETISRVMNELFSED